MWMNEWMTCIFFYFNEHLLPCLTYYNKASQLSATAVIMLFCWSNIVEVGSFSIAISTRSSKKDLDFYNYVIRVKLHLPSMLLEEIWKPSSLEISKRRPVLGLVSCIVSCCLCSCCSNRIRGELNSASSSGCLSAQKKVFTFEHTVTDPKTLQTNMSLIYLWRVLNEQFYLCNTRH